LNVFLLNGLVETQKKLHQENISNNSGRGISRKRFHSTNAQTSIKETLPYPSYKDIATLDESSSNGTKNYSHKHKKRNHSRDDLQEEFKKENPPTFDGEVKFDKEDKSWLIGLKKYFQLHDYSGNTKLTGHL